MKNVSKQNPPVTAAAVAAAVGAVLAAFTSLSGDQVAAVVGVLSIVLAVVAQRFTTPTDSISAH